MTVVELTIDALAAGGEGIGRDPSGRAVFVRGVAPGDRILAEVIEERKSFARALVTELLQPGPGRVAPRCALFVSGQCGGCQWQHLTPDMQRLAKRDVVVNALRKVASPECIADVLELVPDYAWRRVARMHWARPNKEQPAILGFLGPRSKRIVSVRACEQLVAPLQDVVAQLQERLTSHLYGRGELSMVCGGDNAVAIRIEGRCNVRPARELVGRGFVVGVTLNGTTYGQERVPLGIDESAAAGEFVQASETGNRSLVACVADAVGDIRGLRVIEFHAGYGNFTRALRGEGEIVAVERSRAVERIADARVTRRRGGATDVARAARFRGERFDLVVLDPPRTGALDLMPEIIGFEPSRVVYVSCDPATLARDLALLVEAGYRVDKVWPLDLMPQTATVEVVVRLSRNTEGL